MALNPEVAKQIKEIRQDIVHGASWLSRQAIGIMNLAVEKSAANDVADFLEELRVVGRELMNSKTIDVTYNQPRLLLYLQGLREI